MRFSVLSFIVVLMIVAGSTISTSRVVPQAASSQVMDAEGPLRNGTTMHYPMVKVYVPPTSDLNQVNNGTMSTFGFGGLRLSYYYGYFFRVNFVVDYGNVTVTPYKEPSFDLKPGDHINIAFGTFHALEWPTGENATEIIMVARFLHVTIEKF